MDNLACIIVVFVAYCFWACATYQPKATAATTDAPVETAPKVEEIKPEPQPIVIVERRPLSAFAPVAPVKIATDLNALSIRQLKAMAKERTGTPNAVKGYSALTKAQLIAVLA